MKTAPPLFFTLAVFTAACGIQFGNGDPAGDAGLPDAESAPDTGADGDADDDEWSMSEHPCQGNRTDALWCDDDQTCFVGCGTTTSGTGLYVTEDGGATWEALTTAPAGYFDEGRVNSISRGGDGLLYVGGFLPDSAGVVSVDGDGAVATVFTRTDQVDFSFTVGTFRRASNQRSIAESLTGVGLVYREADGEDWSNGRGFWNDGDGDDVPSGVQLLDLEVHDDRFYGAGSRISQPPMFFLSEWSDGELDFAIVPLTDGFNGEMWGIDVDDDGISLGGVDQERNVGMIYSVDHDSDPTDPSNWSAFDVSTVLPEATTWVTDVCRTEGGVVYATGRESIEEWGFVLQSTDGGQTFSDITPYDSDGDSPFDDVSRCQAFPTGVIVAGANGLFGRNF